jgi:anaerobic ribonucleoside-triphosphate reductase activating protein
VPELVWIVDPSTGVLVVEGDVDQLGAIAMDLLPAARRLECARPLTAAGLPAPNDSQGPTLRVSALWHGSVVEGPGRRSVLQVQGCPIRCAGCAVPETHLFDTGTVFDVEVLVDALLDPIGLPRDGVTILGGEPMAQAGGLAALLRRLKSRGIHTVVYTGYTLAALASRADSQVRAALVNTDLLIDGPYVAALSSGAGEWRGSTNQRVIPTPASLLG